MRPGKKTLYDWCIENGRQDILEQWDYTKNIDVTPKTISYGSGRKVWWICKICGYEWTRSPDDSHKKQGCPVCVNKTVLPGYNDLETWCKHNNKEYILDEWDYEKNGDIKPSNIKPGSNLKFWWKCAHGHVWKTTVDNRTRSNHACPKCKTQTSFPEQALLYYTKQYFPDAINRYTKLGIELDVYIPSVNVAIEYDGVAFHETKTEIEIRKNSVCQEHDIKLIRIREEGLCEYNDCICIMRHDRHDIDDLDSVIKQTLIYMGVNNTDINTKRDNIFIMEQYKLLKLENSFAVKFPELAKEWHPTLNGNLMPENVSYGSNQKVWWICPNGHSYKMSLKSRSRNCICHKCAKERANSKLHIACTCVETGVTYPSFKEAAKQTGIDVGSIPLCCKGIRITAGGYHWKYADDR